MGLQAVLGILIPSQLGGGPGHWEVGSNNSALYHVRINTIRSTQSGQLSAHWKHSHFASRGTNIWEIIRPECQTLKSPICHRTTVLYFTARTVLVEPRCWAVIQQHFSPLWSSIVIFEFKDCQSRVLPRARSLRKESKVWSDSHGFVFLIISWSLIW